MSCRCIPITDRHIAVSTLDSPTVDWSSNPGSGKINTISVKSAFSIGPHNTIQLYNAIQYNTFILSKHKLMSSFIFTELIKVLYIKIEGCVIGIHQTFTLICGFNNIVYVNATQNPTKINP